MTETAQARAGVYGRQSSGNAKSIADQITECVADVEAQGWTLAGKYQDGSSASRYATKTRDDWARILADIAAGKLDVLVLWESSRGDRTLTTWSAMLDLCRRLGVRIRVTSHAHTYDLSRPRDWRSLAEDGVDSGYESEKLSLRTRRGVAAAAAAGRPPMGPAPYGYRRVYNPTTGKLEGQEPDPATAPIVREIFEQAARSVPLSEIVRDLNERGVPAPQGGGWRRMRVRDIALNPAYIGQRKHKTETHTGQWESLIGEATFYAVQRILKDPTRLALARPGRQIHLLTYLAECAGCGGQVAARVSYYACRPHGCFGIRRSETDEFVTEMMIARLAKPTAYSALLRAGEDADQEVMQARGEAAKLRVDLDGWRLSAARGGTTPESLAVIEAGLTEQIRSAEQRAERAAIPPALREILTPGADVRARWNAATLPARREVIRTLAEIRIRSAGQSSAVPTVERLSASRWVGDERTWGEILQS